jgi:hypothetical protein
MKRYTWFAMIVLIAVIGCATPLAVNYDYDTGADFSL